MNAFKCFLLVLLTSGAFSKTYTQNTSNHFPARQSGWWTFGLDGGMAFQSSDVQPLYNGWGFGATLGKNLYYKPDAPVSFDLRGRFLLSRTFGLDGQRSYGILKNKALNGDNYASVDYVEDKSAPYDSSFVFQNYRSTMGELGLEGVLTFNRLRERTGIVLSLFGGIGMDFYRTKTDQLNATGQLYNYFSIPANATSATTRQELKSMLDGDYETTADGFGNSNIKFGLMPGAGIEVGYQFTPHFMIGIGHKITFSRTDYLDGQAWTNNNLATGGNDIAHYTNLHLRWDIEPARRQPEPPRIEIISPEANPFVTDNPLGTVRARIRNINSYIDVTCEVNGATQPFNLDRGIFSAIPNLHTGSNEMRIIASNPAGRDEKTLIIVLEERPVPSPPMPVPPTPVPVPPTPIPVPPIPEPIPPAPYDPEPRHEPEVRIVQPRESHFSTEAEQISLVADIRHVHDRRDVRLLVNGEEMPFSLAENLEASVLLLEGRNRIRVEAFNRAGRAFDEIEVIREHREHHEKRPEVEITHPAKKSETTTEQPYILLASIRHTDNRDDISLFLNGAQQQNFSFDPKTNTLTAELTLHRGDNDVTVRAHNRSGEGEASVLLNRKVSIDEPPKGKKPEISISEPAPNANVKQPDVNLKASVKNISDKNQVKVWLNDAPVSQFEFTPRVGLLTASLKLQDGNNTLKIKATNPDGAAEATITVHFTAPPKPKKPEVSISEPVPNANVKQPDVNLKASVKNVSEKSQVKVWLNDAPVERFEFTPILNLLTASLKLKDGDNIIKVRATSIDGAVEASITVHYTAPPKPKVTILTPANNAESSVDSKQLTATVVNVGSQKDISIMVNNQPVRFEYNSSAQQVSATLKLTPGNNNIKVSASTNAGADEATAIVRYIIPKPTVAIASTSKPVVSPNNPNEATSSVLATVKSIREKKQITVKVNNKPPAVLNFNPATGKLDFTAVLKKGVNTIEISAQNEFGSDSATTTVKFE